MKNPNSNNPTPNGNIVAPPGSAGRGGGGLEECSNCGTKKGWVLHNVRYRAVLRRLCTSCVLRLHPGSFCPFCFLFHQNPQNAPDLVSCSKCPSLSHPDCLPPYAAFSPSPFLCPPCSSSSAPNFSFFRLHNTTTLDKRLAAVLLCAATIAANSMSKALAFARAEANRKVREAAAARKRAREALDRFVILSSAAASGQQRPAADRASEVSGSSNGPASALSTKGANGGLDYKQPL